MTPAYSEYERTRDGYVISTEVERLEINTIHRFLERAYWSTGTPRAVVERAIHNSLPFGLYAADGEQRGFARVTSDFAVFAMLSDVFVLPRIVGAGSESGWLRPRWRIRISRV